MTHFLRYALASTWLFTGIVHAASDHQTVFTLEKAINTALDHNPSLQIMYERITEAEAQLGEAMASFYPQVQTRLSYEHSDNPSRAFGMIISQRRLDMAGMDFNHPGGTDNYRPEVIATYSLYNGGQDSQNSKAAELGITAAELQASALRNRLIESVTSAYYGVLAAREAQKIAEHSIAAVQSELDQTRRRFSAGTVLKSDVLSLEVQLAETQDTAMAARNAVELATSGLKTLTASEQAISVADAAEFKTPHKNTLFSTLLTQAYAQRPELLAANTEVQQAEHQLQAAKGAHLPKANAYVSYGSDSKDLDYSTSRDNVTAGVQVSVDIFSGFANSERVKKAESAVTIAKLNARQTQLAIENELKSADLNLQNALDRLTVTEAAVVAAEEALRLVNAQRAAGTATVTRYLEAEVARDKAKSRAIAARYDALRAEAELNKALGHWSKEPL